MNAALGTSTDSNNNKSKDIQPSDDSTNDSAVDVASSVDVENEPKDSVAKKSLEPEQSERGQHISHIIYGWNYVTDLPSLHRILIQFQVTTMTITTAERATRRTVKLWRMPMMNRWKVDKPKVLVKKDQRKEWQRNHWYQIKTNKVCTVHFLPLTYKIKHSALNRMVTKIRVYSSRQRYWHQQRQRVTRWFGWWYGNVTFAVISKATTTEKRLIHLPFPSLTVPLYFSATINRDNKSKCLRRMVHHQRSNKWGRLDWMMHMRRPNS